MNIAHPFAKENGRTVRSCLNEMLSIDKEDYLMAMERSPIKDTEIKLLLQNALSDAISSKEMFMKGIDVSYSYEGYTLYKTQDLKG